LETVLQQTLLARPWVSLIHSLRLSNKNQGLSGPFFIAKAARAWLAAYMIPNDDLQIDAHAQGYKTVIGIDEVGRGPLAGPVVAAAVVWPLGLDLAVNDSKKLSLRRREAAFDAIMAAVQVGVGMASPAEIDDINIRQATFLAMSRAVHALPSAPDFALVDGRDVPASLSCPGQSVIKGDSKSRAIAAASIIAKVTRDRLMVDLAQQFPGYGWEQNAGYPTKGHIFAMERLGVTPYHRRSFKPVHNMLCKHIS
jgi:ribonuclease HII